MTECSDNCYECNGWPDEDLCEEHGHCYCVEAGGGLTECCECGELDE